MNIQTALTIADNADSVLTSELMEASTVLRSTPKTFVEHFDRSASIDLELRKRARKHLQELGLAK